MDINGVYPPTYGNQSWVHSQNHHLYTAVFYQSMFHVSQIFEPPPYCKYEIPDRHLRLSAGSIHFGGFLVYCG